MKIIVGISGGSGAIYAVSLLDALQRLNIETHLVMTGQGEYVLERECGFSVEQAKQLATHYHDRNDFAAKISSGSFKTDGMVVVPCSMNTVASIANGITSNLLVRAADVVIKERRRLVLVARETPLSPIHLQNMLTLSNMGVTIFPPVPSFYTNPQSLEDIVIHTTGRILDQLGVDNQLTERWAG